MGAGRGCGYFEKKVVVVLVVAAALVVVVVRGGEFVLGTHTFRASYVLRHVLRNVLRRVLHVPVLHVPTKGKRGIRRVPR